jgi:hypothetical protein
MSDLNARLSALIETRGILARIARDFFAGRVRLQPGGRRHGPDRPDPEGRPADRHLFAGDRPPAQGNPGRAGQGQGPLRLRHRALPPAAGTGRGICEQERPERLLRQRRDAQGMLPRAQGRAARAAPWPATRPGLPASAAPSRPPAPSWPCRKTTRPTAWPSSTRWPTGPNKMYGNISAITTCPTTACTSAATRRSAANPAPARSSRARTSAPAAGGGKTRSPRNAAAPGRRQTHPHQIRAIQRHSHHDDFY